MTVDPVCALNGHGEMSWAVFKAHMHPDAPANSISRPERRPYLFSKIIVNCAVAPLHVIPKEVGIHDEFPGRRIESGVTNSGAVTQTLKVIIFTPRRVPF